jgi:hypothetical protein
VAERLKGEGVRVFAIGIGSPEGAPIPAEGGGFRRDSGGDIILSRLDETTLQQVALLTDGRYVRSVTGDLDLEQIYVEGIKATLEDREFEAIGASVGGSVPVAARSGTAGADDRRADSGAIAGAWQGARPRPSRRVAPAPARRRPRRAASAALAVGLSLWWRQRAGARERAGRSGRAPERRPEPLRPEVASAGRPRARRRRRRRHQSTSTPPKEAYEAGDFTQALNGFLDLEVERPRTPR